jgi:hypothetical protein
MNRAGGAAPAPAPPGPPRALLLLTLAAEARGLPTEAAEAAACSSAPCGGGVAAHTTAPQACASGAAPSTFTNPGRRARPTWPDVLLSARLRGPHQEAEAQLPPAQAARLVCRSAVPEATGGAVAPAKASVAGTIWASGRAAMTNLRGGRGDG